MITNNTDDALVVSSGAGGGMAAWVLAEKFLKVLMLEDSAHPFRRIRSVTRPPLFTAPAPNLSCSDDSHRSSA